MERTTGQTGDIVEVVRVLVLMQGAVLVATTIEAALFGIAFGPAAGPAFLFTAAAALLTLATARGLGRRRRWARRLTIVAETVVLAGGLIELGLALALTGAASGLVPILTRVVVPIVVIVALREPSARSSFALNAPPATEAVAEGGR
jgi:hypothetical protein